MGYLKRLLTETAEPFYLEQEEINACSPLKTGRHDLYNAAQVLVSERFQKGELVDLVNTLLHKIHNQG